MFGSGGKKRANAWGTADGHSKVIRVRTGRVYASRSCGPAAWTWRHQDPSLLMVGNSSLGEWLEGCSIGLDALRLRAGQLGRLCCLAP